MVTLKQVTQVTVTSPWSGYDSSKGQSGRGSVFNPTYPIFVFDYQTGQIAVGYVVGSTGYTYLSQADANYLTIPAIYFTPFGYNYALGGGGVCGAPDGCMGNGGSVCGPWWIIVNLSNNSANTYCQGFIPQNTVTAHLQGLGIDFENGYLLFSNSGHTNSDWVVSAVPISEISSVIQNQVPGGLKAVWLTVPSSVSGGNIYTIPFILFQGNYVQPITTSSGLYINVIPLSTLYANMVSGEPSSSSSPISLGNIYTISTSLSSPGQPIGVTFFTGSANYIGIAVPSGSNMYTFVISSSFTVSGSNTFPIQGSYLSFVHSWWSGLVLLVSYSGSTIYLNVYGAGYEYTSVTGSFGFTSAEGYLVVASQALSSSDVTWTVYQILLDHTYVFQNVTISVSGQTVTATGYLYDETTGTYVAGVTVYLVQVNSLEDNYSGDVEAVASGSTNNNGQFSITYTAPSGTNPANIYWGVYYPG